jgi:hypothetical protein
VSVASSSARSTDAVKDTIERTTVCQFAPGPGGHHPHADADTGVDGVRQYGCRRLPQEASADASRDEDGGEREVVWETARFVCVTEAHHDETEEEPTATNADAVVCTRPSVTTPPVMSTASAATARPRPAVRSHPNLAIHRIRGVNVKFRYGSSRGTTYDLET